MTVGKLFEFATKPEQPGLSSSIRLEVTMENSQNRYHKHNKFKSIEELKSKLPAHSKI